MNQDTDKRFCSTVFDVMAAHGVQEAVCSPGSRNAPLLIAAASRGELKKHVVVDERAAAFMALGLAMASQKPVALVCTSGTALLNYGPAVAEAFYQGIPLVVLTADRPRQWIDQDDSQTLRQFEALGNYVKKSYDIPSWGDTDPEMQWFANRVANDAMIEALKGKPGPVHINIALAEPLSGKRERATHPERIITMMQPDTFADKRVLEELAQEAAQSRIMFVGGFSQPSQAMNREVSSFCRLPNVVAMAETLSNLHLATDCYSIDSVLTAYSEEELDRYAPDLVISTGGSLVSRKLKEYLRRNSGRCRHWAVGHNHTTSDCFQSLALRLEADPTRFFRAMVPMVRKRLHPEVADYGKEWKQLREKAREVKQTYVSQCGWSDMKAVECVLDNLPPKSNLFLSNGTAVRYAQILTRRLPHASWCNRGVSGIDGSTSTAIGCAKAYKGPTVLLTGDMSMAYDVGALALPDIPPDFKIVVVDNNGGGIFRFIPTTSRLEEREDFFCAPPILPVERLAVAYGFDYIRCDGTGNPEHETARFFKTPGKCILHLVTPPDYSAEVLRGYMNLKVNKSK